MLLDNFNLNKFLTIEQRKTYITVRTYPVGIWQRHTLKNAIAPYIYSEDGQRIGWKFNSLLNSTLAIYIVYASGGTTLTIYLF